MNRRETNAHATIEWEPADCEDLTDRDNDVAEEEELHFSVRRKSAIVRPRGFILVCFSYLLPTAARFMLDRIIRKTAVKIARPAHSIEPDQLSVVYPSMPQAAQHTQVGQIPSSAKVDSLQIAAAEAIAAS